ncbi:MAG: hypothetical protein H7A33_03605 [Deltaproteobacteria bacterium]|nr:hypothetical protein [Deltaproteobacteria bacterium]
MKHIRHFRLIGMMACLGVLLMSCSARMPKPAKAQSVAVNHFKRYGKKYPTSIYGSGNVKSLVINQMEESKYKMVMVDTILTFHDGHAARALIKMENKFPTGWRVISWETLGYK